MPKGDQIPMFPDDELRLCIRCHTKYFPIKELYNGGWCPECGAHEYEVAVPSDYRAPEIEEPAPKPLTGSTEDYNDR